MFIFWGGGEREFRNFSNSVMLEKPMNRISGNSEDEGWNHALSCGSPVKYGKTG